MVAMAAILAVVWAFGAVRWIARGQGMSALVALAVALLLVTWLYLLGMGSHSPRAEPTAGVVSVIPDASTAARSAVVSGGFPVLIGLAPLLNESSGHPSVAGRVFGIAWIALAFLAVRFYRLDRSRSLTISATTVQITNPDLLRPGRTVKRSRELSEIDSAKRQRSHLMLLPTGRSVRRDSKVATRRIRATLVGIPVTALPRDLVASALESAGIRVE